MSPSPGLKTDCYTLLLSTLSPSISWFLCLFSCFVSYFEFCVLCVFVLFCALFLLLLITVFFTIFVNIYRPLPPCGNPIAGNKYRIISNKYYIILQSLNVDL